MVRLINNFIRRGHCEADKQLRREHYDADQQLDGQGSTR
jgi:hypothetical protein